MSEASQQLSIDSDHGADRLLVLVYEELRRTAAALLSGQAHPQTLQPTALVHEAWLRLVSSGDREWQSRSHFYCAAAEAMRHILVDKARRKGRIRHGGEQERVDVDLSDLVEQTEDDKLLAVNEALDQLAALDPVKADVVKLRYFVGLNHAETAQLLDLSEKTVRRHWNFARVWLYQRIEKEG